MCNRTSAQSGRGSLLPNREGTDGVHPISVFEVTKNGSGWGESSLAKRIPEIGILVVANIDGADGGVRKPFRVVVVCVVEIT